jgi:hypothetical protein
MNDTGKHMTDWEITAAMIAYGGGFVQDLALLWRRGDVHNQATLKAAFPEYWAEYEQIGRTRRDAMKSETGGRRNV